MVWEKRDVLSWAQLYVRQGFSVVPVKGSSYSRGQDFEERMKDSKAPMVRWTDYQTRVPREGEVAGWFTKWPKANVAIITGQISGLVVVDFDSPEAVKWAARQGILDTALVRTSRGSHAYYRYPETGRVANSVNAKVKIDIRAEGGYVIAPPSVHLSGVEYTWQRTPDHGGLAPLPAVFMNLVADEKPALKESYRGVAKGSRNQTLARLCGSWASDDLTVEECLEMAHTWNGTNDPPMSREEVERTVRSICRKHRMASTRTQVFYHEKNLLRFPISTHSRNLVHKPEEISVVYASDQGERKWSVIPSVKWGLPGPFDEAIFMAINRILSDKPKPLGNPVEIGSLRELAGMLNYGVSGRNIKLIKDSLLRLKSLTLVTEKTFYDASSKKFLMDAFGLFDRVLFTGEITDDGEKVKTTLLWLNTVYLKNINASYLSAVDFDTYMSLDNHLARGIYRSLSPILGTAGGLPVRISYEKLVQKLQVIKERYVSKIKEQLKDAHGELLARGVFARIEYVTKDSERVIVVYHPARPLPRSSAHG